MPSSTTTITWHASVREIPQSLWEKCFPPPHEGIFWYETLETCGLQDQFSFFYALVSRNGQAVGIAPCFLHDVPMALVAPPALAWILRRLSAVKRSLGFQRTFFIGSPCSDEGRIGCVAPYTLADVLPALAKAVAEKAQELRAPMTVFKDFPRVDISSFQPLCTSENFFSMPSYPGTRLTLAEGGLPAYLKHLSQKQRHQIQNKLRKSKTILTMDTQVVAKPSEAELAEIFRLFEQTYERGKTKFEKLSITFFERIRECEGVRFILQRDTQSGALLTFMLVFHIGDRVVNKFIGIDYARAGSTFLYFRLFEAAVNYAHSVRARELQSGQTGYRAKLDLGHHLIPLSNFGRHQNRWVNALYRQIGKRVSWSSLDQDLATYLKAHPESEPTS